MVVVLVARGVSTGDDNDDDYGDDFLRRVSLDFYIHTLFNSQRTILNTQEIYTQYGRISALFSLHTLLHSFAAQSLSIP